MITLRNHFKKVPPLFVRGDQLVRSGVGYGSNQNAPSNTRGIAAFTLLEVILAVTIAGALLAGAATLMVSVTNAWLERQDRHFFEDHVDGVTEFLQASFSIAGTEIALGDEDGSGGSTMSETGNEIETDGSQVTVDISGNNNLESGNSMEGNTESTTSSGLMRVSEDPIDWSQPPGFADYQEPLLHFKLRDTPPLLVQTENAPIIGVEAFLHFEDDEGLSLLWYTPLQEDSEDLDDLRRTPLSDLVIKVEYIYWDERFEKWESETEPKEGEGDDQFILPRFLKLTFEFEAVTKERTLTIPVTSRNALIF
jgi:hypothetical protein